MATIGTLAVNIIAKTDRFSRGISKATTLTGRFTKSLNPLNSAVGRLGTGLAAAFGTGAIISNLSRAVERMDRLGKVSAKLGIGTAELAGLRFAAEQTGVSANTLDTALQRMLRRITDASHGSGEAVKALDRLGLSAVDLAKMKPDEQFSAIANAMNGVSSQGEKVRLAFKLFDSEGVDLVRTLDLGSDGLERMQRKAEKLGLAMSAEKIAEVEKYTSAVNELSKITEGISNKIVIEMAPRASKLLEDLTSTASFLQSEGFKDSALSKAGRRAAELNERYNPAALLYDQYQSLFEGAGFQRLIDSNFDNLKTEGLPQDELNARIQERIANEQGKLTAGQFVELRDKAFSAVLQKGKGSLNTLASGMAERFEQLAGGVKTADDALKKATIDRLLGKLSFGLVGTVGEATRLAGAASDAAEESDSKLSRASALHLERTGSVASYVQRAAIRAQNSALERGTREAAIAAKRGNATDKQKTIVTNTRKAAETLERIARHMEKQQPVVLGVAGLAH